MNFHAVVLNRENYSGEKLRWFWFCLNWSKYVVIVKDGEKNQSN